MPDSGSLLIEIMDARERITMEDHAAQGGAHEAG